MTTTPEKQYICLALLRRRDKNKQALQKGLESSLKGKNLLYLEQILYYEMTTIYMRSNNETDRVALPESVPIHLMIVTDITFTKQQTCIMSFE